MKKYIDHLQTERYALVNKWWHGQRGRTRLTLNVTKDDHLRKLLKYAMRAR